MDFLQIRENIYKNRIQIVELDKKGTILNSENTLFQAEKNSKIGNIHPFFEGLEPLLEDLDTDIDFPCINLQLDDKKIIVDINIFKKESKIFMVLFDFTDHYEQSQPVVQEKNEASILKSKLSFERNLLLAHEEFKNKFLAHINHEIRNPFNIFFGFLDMLSKTKLSYEQDEITSVMRKTAEHLKVLLDDMLDISKIEKGIIELKSVPFSLVQVATNANKHFQFKNADSPVEIKFNISESVPNKLIGDPNRIFQILYNLIENAFNNTEEGVVSVKIEVNEDLNNNENIMLNFSISDTGKGIPADKLEDVFDSYYQLKLDALKPLGEGLGLKIVKDLIHALKGSITVKSVENVGSTFLFSIPFTKVPERIVTKKSNPKGTGIITSKKILIIENKEVDQMLFMKTFLKNSSNFKIDFALSGKQALEILKKNEYDLLILKMKLPNINGLDFVKKMRNNADARIQKMPVLFITGKSMKTEMEETLKAEGSAFLPKPYSKNELFKKLNVILAD